MMRISMPYHPRRRDVEIVAMWYGRRIRQFFLPFWFARDAVDGGTMPLTRR